MLHIRKPKDWAILAGPNDLGLIVHSALAVTPKGIPLGLLDQSIWTHNPEERGKRRETRQKPIEEKESYKWLRSMDKSQSGGFLGRKGDGEPGVKVIWKGLNELHIVLKHRSYLSP